MDEPHKVNLVVITVFSFLMGMVMSYCGILTSMPAWRFGAMFGLYSLSKEGVHSYLVEKRGVEDAYASVVGACAAAASFALTYNGPPPPGRFESVMLGIGLSVPLQLLYDYGRGKLNHPK